MKNVERFSLNRDFDISKLRIPMQSPKNELPELLSNQRIINKLIKYATNTSILI
jgi:hypothetical protein